MSRDWVFSKPLKTRTKKVQTKVCRFWQSTDLGTFCDKILDNAYFQKNRQKIYPPITKYEMNYILSDYSSNRLTWSQKKQFKKELKLPTRKISSVKNCMLCIGINYISNFTYSNHSF